MKSLWILYILCFSFVNSYSQTQKNHFKIITKKGILFLSFNNAEYIDSLRYQHVRYEPYLSDIFIPVKKMNAHATVMEDFRGNNLQKGILLGVFDKRIYLKSIAETFSNDSIYALCYKEKYFALIPVIITYKKYSDYPKVYNCENQVTLKNDKKVIRFSYTTPSIEIIKVRQTNLKYRN